MRAQVVDLTVLAEAGMARMRAALRALETCDSSQQAHADLKYALGRNQILPPIDYLDATYGEMVASGAHARIRSQGLKRQLAQAFSALREYNMNLRNFRISVPTVDTIVWNHVDYGIDEGSGRPVVKFDMNEGCSIRPLRNAVVEMIDIQQDGASTGRRAISSVDQALALFDQ